MSRRTAVLILLALCAALGALALIVFIFIMRDPPAAPVDFERQVADVLSRRCVTCHNAEDPKNGLDLSTAEGLAKGGMGGPVVVPKKPDESRLVKRVAAGTMPPKKAGPRLSDEEVAGLRSWVHAGAAWPEGRVLKARESAPKTQAGSDWWSLQAPRDVTPPSRAGSSNPLDAFLSAKRQAAETDRVTLIRRATFDLLGLPPTPAEIDVFVNDAAPDAYERLIDRLLASPHYGECWGRHWLDVVRFGESDGFENDKLRAHAWHYRDYVIRSFNADKPYPQFVKEQLAGDMLGPVTHDSLAATGFLVAGPWDEIQNVGASKLEKARAHEEQLEELIAAVSQTFLGLTVNCARCHDHKFDPIPQTDYYRLKAVFDGVDHGDRPLLTPEEEKALAGRTEPLRQKLAELKAARAEIDLAAKLKTTLPADALVEGRFGKGLDARRAHVALASRPELQKPPFTVECWARVFSKAGFNILVANNLKESGNHWELYTYAGAGDFSVYMPGYTPAEIRSGADITDGQWHHVACAFNGEHVQLFVDAKLVKETPVGRQRFDASQGLIWLGAYPPQNIGCDGVVDEVRIRRGMHPIETLPEGAFTADEQTLALWHLDTADVDWRAGGVSPPVPRAVEERNTNRDSITNRGADAPRSPETLRVEIQNVERELVALSPPLAYVGTRRQPSPVHLLNRGDIQKPGAEVQPGNLTALRAALPGFDLPNDTPEGQRRLRFAEWVVHPDNPLPARVIVNRIWHYHFGQGLVDTPSDFGVNGGEPSHPELLDWLAREFMRGEPEASAPGGSIKHMHRLIMNSATYRQRSLASGSRLNELRRLDAEAIRDAMLAVSGELNEQIGGPSFRPFTVTIRNHHFYHLIDKDTPESNRRTVYRMNINTGKSPFLDALDCPAPSITTPKRRSTTTPLQALALMNDSFVQRQARRFAQRALREAGSELADQVTFIHRVALGRYPSADERTRMMAHVQDHGLESACWVILNSSEFLWVR